MLLVIFISKLTIEQSNLYIFHTCAPNITIILIRVTRTFT